MNVKLLSCLMILLPYAANASIPYRSEHVGPMPATESDSLNNSDSFASEHRFYIGGGYNYSMWNNFYDKQVSVQGKAESGFDVSAGIRIYDTFRLEANYMQTKMAWDDFSVSGHSVFANAIFDARIDSKYRLFRKQRVVPYVGFGAGANWNSSDDISLKSKSVPIMSALAGIGFELGEHFALDIGYRYIYVFKPFEIDGAQLPYSASLEDFSPKAHQLRAGFRLNF